MHLNPYSPPELATAEPGVVKSFLTSRRLLTIVARWTLICAVSAGPSFFWGCVLHHQAPQVTGMLCGILVFILGYTWIECSPVYRRVIRWPHVRTTVWIGYGTRLAISIIFPIAIFVDGLLGVCSMTIVQPSSMGEMRGEADVGFLLVFLTTVVQGILLNLVLFAYMSLVWCLVWMIAQLVRWTRGPTLAEA